jgi:hypothetical protein
VGSNQVDQTRNNGDQEEIIIFVFKSVVTEFWGRVIQNLV